MEKGYKEKKHRGERGHSRKIRIRVELKR